MYPDLQHLVVGKWKVLSSVYSLVIIACALDLEVKISFGGGESCSPETK